MDSEWTYWHSGITTEEACRPFQLPIQLFVPVVSSRNWIWLNRIELRDRLSECRTNSIYWKEESTFSFFFSCVQCCWLWTCWFRTSSLTVWTGQKLVCPSGKKWHCGIFPANSLNCGWLSFWENLLVFYVWKKACFCSLWSYWDLSLALVN